MFFNKNKKYLKRLDFINLADSEKIWSKSMTLIEIKELLESLENEIQKYSFDNDKNFIMNSRRRCLRKMIEERLSRNDTNPLICVSESLFNFWEFVGDEYPGNIISDIQELGISIKEFDTMDKLYRDKGIICVQEKDVIIDIITKLKKYINERCV